jgi:hypothetical protein
VLGVTGDFERLVDEIHGEELWLLMAGVKDGHIRKSDVTCGNFVVSGSRAQRIFKPECVSRQQSWYDVEKVFDGYVAS